MSDPWDGILQDGEEILWQGAPDPGFQIEFDSPFTVIFFIFWTSFSIFWCVMASQAGGFFWALGLLLVGIGLYNLVGVHFWKSHLRRHTFYTLTNHRAFIATQSFGKRHLASYPIRPEQPINLTDKGQLGDVGFAEEVIKSNDGDTTRQIAFERIPDARHVLGLMHQIQERQT